MLTRFGDAPGRLDVPTSGADPLRPVLGSMTGGGRKSTMPPMLRRVLIGGREDDLAVSCREAVVR